MTKKELPLISVVMLNYNGLKYLKKTIKPILNQDYPNFEFIIVDNGSTDGSIEYIKKFDKIQLVKNGKNLGYSRGKNIGMKKSSGKYVLLLDNDIQISNLNALSNLDFKKTSKQIISIPLRDSNKKKISYYGGFFYKTMDPLFKSKEYFSLREIPLGYPNGGAFFISKKNWTRIGGFDESQQFYLDDKDFGARANVLGLNVILFSKFYFIHLGHGHKQNLDSWVWKYKYYYSGYMRTICKNFTKINILKYGFLFSLFSIVKTIKNCFKLKSLKPFSSFCFSILLFLKNFPNTIEERKKIQSKRKIKKDLFLKISPPKFN